MSKRPTQSYRSWPVKKLEAQKKCARGSLRAVTPRGRSDVRIIICCPPGRWSERTKKCKVSMRGHLEYKKNGRGPGFAKSKRA